MATLARPAQRTIYPSSRPFIQRLGRVFIYALLVTIGLVLFTPFILAFLGTFKTDSEIVRLAAHILPTIWRVGTGHTFGTRMLAVCRVPLVRPRSVYRRACLSSSSRSCFSA